MMTHQLSLRFGKEEGFTAGLILLPFIFYPLLGMSELQFKDSAVASEIDNIGID
jgi:hypothetical protein